MNHTQELRLQLVNLLSVRQVHMSFEDAVRDFPLEHINTKPQNVPYSFWHLLEHLRICQRDILDYIRDPNYTAPNFPDDLWPDENATTDEAGWRHTISQFQADLAALIALVNDPATDIYEQIPHGAQGHTILREVLIVADHNAYHIGEFAILRQTLGLW